MKRGVLLNAPLSALVARMGHTDEITVCDAGLPIPAGPERIDLALMAGTPSLETVLTALLTDLVVEKVIMASEIKQISPPPIRRWWISWRRTPPPRASPSPSSTACTKHSRLAPTRARPSCAAAR